MEENLREVLIKKVGNKLHDKVLIVENLPRKFLFEQTRKMVQRIDRDGYPDGTLVVAPSGELVWTLRPGIEKSQTGDGGFVFDTMDREAMERLADIMRYIEMSFSRDKVIPAFVDNAQQIGDARTGPIAYFQMPRISLPPPAPAPVPLLAPSTETVGSTASTVTINLAAQVSAPPDNRTPQGPAASLPKKKGMTEEQRLAASARMKKMHEDRKKARAVAA